jgi:thiamine biosynthesis lipoprotein
MAEVLREWDCDSFLLVAGGSSILAGEPPPASPAWSCGLGDDNSPVRYSLKNCSLSGSGLAVKGKHIIDPRTGKTAHRQNRAWALAKTAAESDALSTAFMVLDDAEVSGIIQNLSGTFAWLQDGNGWKEFGDRKLLSNFNDPASRRQC